jgi:hypothetical protein
MDKRIERLPARVDKYAEREQRGAADSVLAMDQHLVAAPRTLANECHPFFQMLTTGSLHVGCRQAEKVDPGGLKRSHVVALFGAKIDNCANPMRLPKESG